MFFFHGVRPNPLRRKLEYLEENGYTALIGDELLQVMEGEEDLPERGVVLTFDDGMASLYSVAFPLLRKFGFRAISFIVPGCIPDSAPETATYEDVQAGRASHSDTLSRESSAYPLCSWEEIREMNASGRIDFQAHSLYHRLVHVGPELVDFLHPGYDRHVAHFNVPAYHTGDGRQHTREVENGAPVFRFEPRMSGQPQYFDDREVREACIQFIDDQGGEAFFERWDWRRRLTRFYQSKKAGDASDSYETEAEMRRSIFNELSKCKAIIERRLSDCSVKHFCFPWFTGSDVAVELAEQAGYRALYWGMRDDAKINRSGGDPMHTVRLDSRYIYRLPGQDRKSLTELLGKKIRASVNASL